MCADKLRLWRRFGCNLAVLDLRRAYLQVFVEPALQLYQAVKYNGETYLMTRMAFGLSVAPKIMSAIVYKILSMEERVSSGTDSYVDDILIDEDVVNAEHVETLLKRFGLTTKPVERLRECEDGIRVLGLRVYLNGRGKLMWKRDGLVPELNGTVLTRRKVFSICGKLVGHFPIASWLRVACNFIKRQTGQCSWDEAVSPRVIELISRLFKRVVDQDPVSGVWVVPKTTIGEVWADASGLAYGACVKINGDVVEDASWLRPVEDAMHINVAELDASIKGINMALRWDLREIVLHTDSRTCAGWLRAIVDKQGKIHTRGMAEMLVRRRLAVLRELIDQYKLAITVRLVASEKNCADVLTRIDRTWVKNVDEGVVCAVGQEVDLKVRESHDRHHFGVDKTLELMDPKIAVSRASVDEAISSCVPCQSVDPSIRERWKKGSIAVDKLWFRVAIDVTHFRGKPFLTAIDCCSRYAVWKPLHNENAGAIAVALEDVFASFGPPSELLMDNAPVFSSDHITALLRDWDVSPRFSAAYRSQGNGLIERNHRTIKAAAERSGKSVQQIVAFYNNTTHSATKAVPYELLFVAKSKIAGGRPTRESFVTRPVWQAPLDSSLQSSDNPFLVGDEVFVKPPNARCTTRWYGPVRVAEVVDGVKVKLEGIAGARHVSHLRRYVKPNIGAIVDAESSDEDTSEEETAEHQDESNVGSDSASSDVVTVCEHSASPRRTTRDRHPVDRLLYSTLGGN